MFKSSKALKVLRGSLWLILGWSLVMLNGCVNNVVSGGDEGDESDILTLTLGKSQLGTIERKGETKLYRVHLEPGQRYRFEWKDARDPNFLPSNRNDAIAGIAVRARYGTKDGSIAFEDDGWTKQDMKQNITIESKSDIFIEVWAYNNSATGIYQIEVRPTDSRDLETFPAPEVKPTANAIQLNWDPPPKATYQNILRKYQEAQDVPGSWKWIGAIKREKNSATEPLGDRCYFTDYFTDPSRSYSYKIEGGYLDTISRDWILMESLPTGDYKGVSADDPEPAETYTVSYNQQTGVIAFDPPLKAKTNHPSYGIATGVLEFWDEITSECVYFDLEKELREYRVYASDFSEYFTHYGNIKVTLNYYPAYTQVARDGIITIIGRWIDVTLKGDTKIIIPPGGGDITVTEVKVTPNKVEVAKGETQQFSAEVIGSGNPPQSVIWSLEGNKSEKTLITPSDGLLILGEEESATTLTVIATSTADTAKSGAAMVTVSASSSTITSVTITPPSVEVAKGGIQQFSATVKGSNNPSQSVSWSVSGGVSGTSISPSGLLTIASNETATTLTVRAASTADSAKSGAAAVTVKPATSTMTVTSVTVSPLSVAVEKGSTQQFSATVNGSNNPPQSVNWSVSGGVSGTSISPSGLLILASNETATTLTVRATSTADSAKSGAAVVTVTVPPPTVTSVTVSPLSVAVEKGSTQQFSAAVNGTGNPSQSVSWSVSGGVSGTSISPSGLLTIGPNETATTLTVRATSTADFTKSGTAEVRVTASVATLASIAITTPPAKTTYTVGESLDTAGMAVTATYSDGSTAGVTGYSTRGFDSSAAAASQRVTVSYTEGGVTKTAAFFVTINPVPISPPEMVSILGGTFMMGSPDSDWESFSWEKPQHSVTVSSFYMSRYEVTQGEYQAVMGRNPSSYSGDNLPVESVSWYDAIDYCNALSQREGLTPAYTRSGDNVSWNRFANGYRLPTEAEWEYACRAGTTTPYYTGNSISLSQANYWNDSGSNGPKPVGSYAPNPWGLYDMAGNVWEWCWDWYGEYSSGAQTNPEGPYAGADRVFRGGSWGGDGQDLRSANRFYYDPSYRLIILGFRLVRPSS
jgi:formylglycine-generating enzyme required for sulfatase activity